MSSRGLLRSMAIVGGAKSLNILVGILRVKALALMLGPAGIGALGILSNFMQTGTALAGLGLGQSGVREIAASRRDAAVLGRVRRVLLYATILQGLLAMTLIWLLREPLARLVFADPGRALEVGLLGMGVALSLIAASQTALLQGMQRVGSLARITILSGLCATATGLMAVWLLGTPGLVVLVLSQPFFSILIAAHYARALPRAEKSALSLSEAAGHWRVMAALGIVFVSASLLQSTTLLVLRSYVTREMGIEAAGHLQAAWSINVQYFGILLGAVTIDFYPRLTAIGDNSISATRLVNEQTQLLFAIGGPVLLLVTGLAPWILTLLYSDAFAPATPLAQWQSVGNLIRTATWPLGFILIAQARSGWFFSAELLRNALLIGAIAAILPYFGLESIGVAFLISFVCHFFFLTLLIRRLTGFRWEQFSLRLGGTMVLLAAVILAAARLEPLAGAALALVLAPVTGLWGLRIVAHKLGREGRLGNRLNRIFKRIGWPLRSDDEQ